jgi:hypothetical protein
MCPTQYKEFHFEIFSNTNNFFLLKLGQIQISHGKVESSQIARMSIYFSGQSPPTSVCPLKSNITASSKIQPHTTQTVKTNQSTTDITK